MTAKQNQIPVTTNVTPYPTGMPKEQLATWFQSIAGFCRGAQGVKKNEEILSVRIGSMVFFQGSITVIDESELTVLPVSPRIDGFVLMNDGTDVLAATYQAGSKEINVSGFQPGAYDVMGNYFAEVRR